MASAPTPAGPERITYQGKMHEVVEQPVQVGDTKITFEFSRRAPGTRLIIPLPDNKILLTREYRSYLNGYDFRLPGGKVLDSLDELNAFRATGRDIGDKAREACYQGGT